MPDPAAAPSPALGAAPSLFQLLEGARPVLLEQAGQRPVGEELATRLAARAVVGLVLGVDDPLDGGPAHRAWLPVAAVDRHRGMERGHVLGKALPRLAPEP